MTTPPPHTLPRWLAVGALVVLLWGVGGGGAVYGQPCVCTDCPQALDPVSDFEICYTVAGLTNPTLGANGQGVCGVSLDFSHDYIENLTITLISPAGQSVRLVGPGSASPGTIATTGASWDIDFVPCNVFPNPYPGTGPRFASNNSNWNVLLQRFIGSYHPNAGCLSNFDTGPANGQWCIRVQSNAITSRARRVRDFRVTFCDETGPGCCEAAVPVYTGVAPRDTVLCAGDPALAGSFAFAPAANAIYEQRLVVSRSDIVQSYSTGAVDLRAATPGTYEICGLEYWVDQASSLPSVGQRRATIPALVSRGQLCAAIEPTCVRWTVVARPPVRVIDTTLCDGDRLEVAGQTFTTPITRRFNLVSAGGCDSVIDLRLRFSSPTRDTLRRDLCSGETLTFFGQRITRAGVYREPLRNRFGCDSTIVLLVALRQPVTTQRALTLCAGDSVGVGSLWLRRDTTITERLSTVHGCDSTATTTVIVLRPDATITATDTLLTCARTSVRLVGTSVAGPPGTTITAAWTHDGSPAGQTPALLVAEPGRYSYATSLTLNGTTCVARDTQVVARDTIAPSVQIVGAGALTCDTTARNLRARVGGFRQNLLYTWLLDGRPIAGDSITRATAPGRYTVRVERAATGCSDTLSVLVTASNDLPVLRYTPPQTLTCIRDSVLLDAGASVAPDLAVEWLDPSGATLPVFGSAGFALAREIGTYTLRVRHLSTGCTDTAQVSVRADQGALGVAITGVDTLDCVRGRLDLVASSTAPADFTWIDGTGDTLSRQALLTVVEAGGLTVVATDVITGCSASTSVRIHRDTLLPDLDLPDTLSLVCGPGGLQLRGRVGPDSARYQYAWLGPANGLRRSDGASAIADSVGVYQLLATDPRNGCTAIDSVRVVDLRVAPVADAGPDQRLDCDVRRVSIGGAGAGAGGVNYLWRGPTNSFAGRLDSARTVATGAGLYIVTAVDTLTGCSARDSVTVVVDRDLPQLILADSATIACGDTAVRIRVTTDLDTARTAWSWQRAGATRVDTVGPSFVADLPGLYQAVLRDRGNGCEQVDSIVVVEECPTRLVLADRDTLNCRTGPDITLDVPPLALPGLSVAWSSELGLVIAGADTWSPRVRGPGVYVVEVRRGGGTLLARDSIEIVDDRAAPGADAGPDLVLDCLAASTCVGLEGSSPSTEPALEYAWLSAGGRFCADTTGARVRANAPGLYELTVTDPRNGCTSTDALNVTAAPGVPIPDAGPDRVLECGADSIDLVGRPPRERTNLSWWWIDAAGLVMSAPGDSMLRVGAVGTYAFVARDEVSGCTVADSVHVVQRGCAPRARPVASGTLDCRQAPVTLSTAAQAGMRYRWTGVDLAFGPVTTREVTVTAPGTYRLVVIGAEFGLVDSAEVTVNLDTLRPRPAVAPPAAITCAVDSVALDASPSTAAGGGGLRYAWSGGSLSPLLDTLARARVTQAGTYLLTVEALGNGCRDSLAVAVTTDTVAPRIEIALDGAFDCQPRQVAADASASTGTGPLTYAWRALEGQNLSGVTLARVLTDAPGHLELTVRDASNGCVAADTVEVPGAARDFVDAGDDGVLDCVTGRLRLAGSAASGASGLFWTGPAPGCLSDSTALDPVVACGGTYVLHFVSANGACTYRDSLEVEAPVQDFGLAVTGDSVLTCNVPESRLVGSATVGGLTKFWRGGGVVQDSTLTVTAGGTYVWIAESSAGCVDSVVVIVLVDTDGPAVTSLEPDTLTCTRTSTTLGLAGLDSARYDVTWSDPLGRPLAGANPTTSEAGEYDYAVSDRQNGCSTLGTVVVTIDTIAPTVRLTARGSGSLRCDSPQVRVEVTTPGGPASYRWRGPAGQRFVAGAVQDIDFAGQVWVEARDERTGCVAQDSLMVTDGRPPFEPYTLTRALSLPCSGDGVALTAGLPAELSGRWLDAAGDELPTPRATVPGLYLLELTQLASACVRLDSVSVSAYVAPFSASVTVEGELGCAVEQVLAKADITDAGAITLEFAWVDPAGDTVRRGNARQVALATAGTWTLAVRDIATTCWLEVPFDISRAPGGIEGVGLSVRDAGCPGERGGLIEVDTVLGGRAPFAYALDGGAEQRVGQFGLLEAGVYELRIEDAAGCRYRESVPIAGSGLKGVRLPDTVELARGDSLCLQPELSGVGELADVRWGAFRQNLPCVDCPRLCWVPLESDEITLTASVDGCPVSARTSVRVTVGEVIVYPTAFSPNGDLVNDTWWVRAVVGARITRVSVYDRWGGLVHEEGGLARELAEWTGDLAGEPLSAGVYLVHVRGEDFTGVAWDRVVDVTLLK